VSRAALADAPRGETLGIPGAPASLPTPDKLRKGAWTVCSTTDGSVLFVGGGPTGGTPLEEKGLLVTGPGPRTHLLWHGHKHLIRQPASALPALVWSARPAVAVSAALLNAVPSGTDLVTPAVPDRGRSVPEGRIGQLYSVTPTDNFLVTGAGLASVTPLQAQLLAGVGGKPLPLGPAEFSALVQGRAVRPFAPDPGGEGALPSDVPELLDAHSSPVCTAEAITIGAGPPDLSRALRTASATPEGAVLADRIVVPPGSGALVRTETGVTTLVTDLGRRHAVPVPDALAALGYASQPPVPVPASVVALVPPGPALDPAAAALPAQ
jgi:type VII secretion protein EccB